MDFLKKHYEKILLGVMLAGLIGVLVFMLFYIAADTEAMTQKRESLTNPMVKELTNLDTTIQDAAMTRSKSPYDLDLETVNKLFNPMKWEKALDGTLILAKKTGVEVAVVTNIAPLYTIVSLESVVKNDIDTNYVIQVEHQAASTPAKRHPTRHYLSINEKPSSNDAVALRQVKGPGDNPEGLVLKLADMDEPVTVATGKPYTQVAGYMADFNYPPEKKAFKGKRESDKISFGGTDYTVVEVNSNELILQDLSNQKKTSLHFPPD